MNKKLLSTLLNLLSKYPLQVNKLIYANKIDTYDNDEFQEYSIDEMSKFIFETLKSELCFVYSFDKKSEKEINISQKAIVDYQRHQTFDFGRYDGIALTAKGGEIWEKEFQPNWHYFIDGSGYQNHNEMLGFEILYLNSTNKDLLDNICKNLSHLPIEIYQDHNWFLSNYRPYYWKVINDSVYCFTITANTFDDKLLLEKTLNSLGKYDKLFCPKTHHP